MSKPYNNGPKFLYAIGFVELEIAAIDLPQKLFLGKIILALSFLTLFFSYPHFLASFIADSAASTPEFIGRTLS